MDDDVCLEFSACICDCVCVCADVFVYAFESVRLRSVLDSVPRAETATESTASKGFVLIHPSRHSVIVSLCLEVP